jgi:hypothetical protein
MAQRAREFEGYYNMIRIKYIRDKVETLKQMSRDITVEAEALSRTLDWQEDQNKPLAEAFEKRKQEGRQRNYEQ